MGRRIEVELTSARDDGSWTWHAAGAKQPKGDVSAALLYEGAKIGDVVKVEAEFHLDGIEITEVFAPKSKKERTDLLEMKIRPLRDDELVTTHRVSKGGERRGDRKGGRDRDRGQGRGRSDERRGSRGPERGGSAGGERRGPRQEPDHRPRPKRLRPRRVHRDALLAQVTEEHRPIVEQVIKDGMPGVRAAMEKQNSEAKAAGKPEIDATPILAIAEKNLSKARLAEWRDRADAALANAAELDIRDLRSVVVAGADVARDEESRALAEQIKAVLDERLESDHAAWLKDLDSAVSEARVVRGLRLSSRPVKAGAPLPTEIASKLSQQASEALAPDVLQDRWATVLDALAFSPVRGAVKPVGIPAEPSEALMTEVRRLSERIPAIAALFGIDPAEVPKSAKRRRPPRKGQKPAGKPAAGSQRPVPGAEKAKPPTDSASRSGGSATEAAAPDSEDATGQTTEQPTGTDTPAADNTAEAMTAHEPASEPQAEPPTEAPAAAAVAVGDSSGEPEPVASPSEGAEAQAADEPSAAQEPAAEKPTVAKEPAAEEPAVVQEPAEPPPQPEEPTVAEAPAEEPPAVEETAERAPAPEASVVADPPVAREAATAPEPAEETTADQAPTVETKAEQAPEAEAPATEAPATEAPAELAPEADAAPAESPVEEEVADLRAQTEEAPAAVE